jgi:serine/threonine protein phosphatase 1
MITMGAKEAGSMGDSCTIAIGDIHGHLQELEVLLARLPVLTADDTLLFIGDYLDRGPDSAGVVRLIREDLPNRITARIVTLRGNHEAAWLGVLGGRNPDFVLPAGNGCLATLRSFTRGPVQARGDFPSDKSEMESLVSGSFFPAEVTAWMADLPYWHEDDHALYVHGGLPQIDGRWLHPSAYTDPTTLVWCRERTFFSDYRGKRVVFGHTPASHLPQQLSTYTPADPSDLFYAGDIVGIDTGCGSGGFLSAIELPSMTIYESR